jgi:hypothetical protein
VTQVYTFMRGLLALFLLLFPTSAFADYDSAYSDLDLENKSLCKVVTPVEPGDEAMSSPGFECKGYKDYAVSFAEGDLRSFVSFGKQPGDHCAATQTFGGFNTVGKKIEWRLKNGTPIATILRWTVAYDPEDPTKKRSWLVVTKLEDGNSCHMGYVEGGYPQANEKARWLADTGAETFSCKTSRTLVFANAGTAKDSVASEGGCGN